MFGVGDGWYGEGAASFLMELLARMLLLLDLTIVVGGGEGGWFASSELISGG